MAVPFGEHLAPVEGQSRRCDHRVPVIDRLLHPLARGDPLVDRRARIVHAIGDDRPAVVPARLDPVQLVPALRPVLDGPKPPVAVQRRRLHVAQTLGVGFRQAHRGVPCGGRPGQGVDADDLAQVVVVGLRRIADRHVRTLAQRHEQVALPVRHHPAAEVLVAVIDRHLREDLLDVFQRRVVRRQRGRGDRRMVAALRGCGIADPEPPALGEVGGDRHVQQPALAARRNLGKAADGIGQRAAGRDDPQPARTLGHQPAAVGKLRHAPGMFQPVRDEGRVQRDVVGHGGRAGLALEGGRLVGRVRGSAVELLRAGGQRGEDQGGKCRGRTKERHLRLPWHVPEGTGGAGKRSGG